MTTTQRVRAADQGPLDWLVPFIPPAFRVNRDTRADIRRKAAQLTSRETLKSFVLALRPHWRFLTLSSFAVVIWIKGLVYIHKHEPEFAVAYIIVSGFFLLAYHLFIGGEVRTDDISAYSVFNRGAQRMMGSLNVRRMNFATDNYRTKMLRLQIDVVKQRRSMIIAMRRTTMTISTLCCILNLCIKDTDNIKCAQGVNGGPSAFASRDEARGTPSSTY